MRYDEWFPDSYQDGHPATQNLHQLSLRISRTTILPGHLQSGHGCAISCNRHFCYYFFPVFTSLVHCGDTGYGFWMHGERMRPVRVSALFPLSSLTLMVRWEKGNLAHENRTLLINLYRFLPEQRNWLTQSHLEKWPFFRSCSSADVQQHQCELSWHKVRFDSHW